MYVFSFIKLNDFFFIILVVKSREVEIGPDIDTAERI